MENEDKEILDNIFKNVQNFLKHPPLIVWGSGATIPYGIPSMQELNTKLKIEISNFNENNENLEIELGKEKYKDNIPIIKKIIWKEINEADRLVLESFKKNDTTDFKGIRLLIQKFIEPHPQVMNIVTTNYDRVLEYTMSYYDIPYTDGFNGKLLSSFNEELFQSKNIINLIKVHGSLNWFNLHGEIRYADNCIDKFPPQIITPGKNKYQDTYTNPYRELIQRADDKIKEAKSFLVIGFGFNDEHLTPKIKTSIKKGIPIVLITKKITENTYTELKKAKKYILFEEMKAGQTKVIYKLNYLDKERSTHILGDYWKLSEFMEII